MFKSIFTLTTLWYVITISSIFADCCQCVDISIGWRRDSLHWKTNHLDGSYIPGHAKSHILFKDINSYTLSGKAKWASSSYYVRFSAEYGLTDKGRAKELFKIHSPYLFYPIEVETNDHIKRRSEVYDFDGAVGYPLSFCCNRLSVVPLIGFSFHRQHLRVREHRHESSSSYSSYSYYDYFPSYSSFFSSHSSSAFRVSSSNPFTSFQSSNPFSSYSTPNIASELGLSNPHRTSNYRFTWYGFYLGTDLAYALDSSWTIFSELEFHFLDRCHRKRKSWTGVDYVDKYHKESFAYGFDGTLGVTYSIASCWYTTLGIDFKWWQGHAKRDHLEWKSVGAKIGLGYTY